jgi:tripartite-type tricarboxylate transporter receptor subunit TctC
MIRLFKLICIFTILASAKAFALPDEFNVYIPNAGIKNIACRAIFDSYALKYDAHPLYMTKEGTTGMAAMLAMLNDKKLSVMCAGPSEHIFNNYAYPGHEAEHNMLIGITMVANGPVIFYSGNNSKVNNIKELLKENRPVTVGYHASIHKVMIQIIFEGKNVIFVPYTSPNAAIPSLMDGSLDMYIETGALYPMVTAGKLKSIGIINGSSKLVGPDVTKDFIEISKLPLFLSVSTSKDINPVDLEELNHRINLIIQSKEVSTVLETLAWFPATTTVSETNKIIKHFKTVADKITYAK